MVDIFPFFRPLMPDTFFYSNLRLVQLLLIKFTISTEFGIRSSAVFQYSLSGLVQSSSFLFYFSGIYIYIYIFGF